ncbi:hypothetical protein B7463_g9513, partial [Scytalidium lignicola]
MLYVSVVPEHLPYPGYSDLETNILVDNNNEQQPEEGSEEGFKKESEEGSEEVSKESSEDSSEEELTKGLTVGELSRASGKRLVPSLPKPDLELVQVPKAPSLDLDLDFEPEDNVKQILIVILKEVKIIKLNLFYEDKKKFKAYLV